MINTMTGSPEMQPLMTVLAAALGVGEPAGRQVATLGYQREEEQAQPEPSRRLYGYPPPSWSACSAQRHARTQASAGAGHPSALTVRTTARGDLDMSRLPDKIILR
jgi:hypothetical protein